MPTVEEFRRMSLGIAEAIAPGWERRRGLVESVVTPVREWILRELDPQPGETVLELAAGAGDTGFEAAAAVGETGRLITTDFSPAMLDVARRRGGELGIGNVEYRVVDAEQIDLDEDSVDRVVCRFGYMLMADPAKAFAETRRVLRPGGRVALAVWGAPDRNPYFAAPAMALVQRGHIPPPDPGMPNPFSLAGEDHTRGLLEGAGFDDVRMEEIAVTFSFPDIDECFAVTADTAGPMGVALQRLSDHERDAVKSQFEQSLAPFAAGDGYRIPGVALAASAG